MARFRVGYQIHPQHCSIDQIRDAYRSAEALGVDVLYVWDHMYPLYGDPEGPHYTSTPILAGMAVETTRAQFGTLVSSVAYRNPEHYAYEVWTLDRLSQGRAILGIGAGWFERDYPVAVAKAQLNSPGAAGARASTARSAGTRATTASSTPRT